ncbi:MAG: holo-[acyl-carrier-protein] synthase [Candidatus Atribacteria bacterium]|nr:MAG: holo-[acyl-carrier-protein] synthase [Candidatus Atribacteria bacterium]
MIVGCGIDLVKVERIEKIIKRWGNSFTSRIFTSLEGEYCEKKKINKFQSYAGRFAAKEALLKSLGLGLKGANWKEIEVRNDELGQPSIDISGKLKNIASAKGVSKYFVSISHTKEYAIAQVILESILDK